MAADRWAMDIAAVGVGREVIMEDTNRIADEPIYLEEDRYKKPKELFKYFGDLIEKHGIGENATLLDAGCATGELIYYLRARFQEISGFSGIDISDAMIQQAASVLPDATFAVGSLTEPSDFTGRDYDIVTCSGVLSCFDEPEIPVINLLNSTRAGGGVYIYSPFNDDPIDVISRYRRAYDTDSTWESGWNIFSRATMERLLAASGYDLRWEWHRFDMPFDLDKRPDDPMRTWTVRTERGDRQTVNGACQLINGLILAIHVNGVPEA